MKVLTHIKRGSVPRAVPGITVGHEMVGVAEELGSAVTIPLITHRYQLADIEAAYRIFEQKPDGVIKIAIE